MSKSEAVKMSKKMNNTDKANTIDDIEIIDDVKNIDDAAKDIVEVKNTAKPNESKPSKSAKASIIIDPLEGFTVILDGVKAKKLSTQSQDHIFYQVASKDDDKTLHLRLAGNEGGGLHSKEWISIEAILKLIEPLNKAPFTSKVFKPLFGSTSTNNAAFLAAVLRSTDLGLLVDVADNQFKHQLSSNFEEAKAKLLALAK